MRKPPGFTLLELVVVTTLIAVVLTFSLPRLAAVFGLDPAARATLWIRTTVRQLKTRAVAEQTRYLLVLDLDAGTLRVAAADPPEDDPQGGGPEAGEGYRLEGGMQLVGVEFPGRDPVTGGRAEIRFHPKGFSDDALIHLIDDDGDPATIHVPPFLPEARFHDRLVRFNR